MNQGRFVSVDKPVEELVSEALGILEEAKATYRPVKTYVLLSGGNDSTTLAHLVCSMVDAAVHIRTGIGIPQTSAFVRDTCSRLGLPLIELVTPPEVYRNIVLGTKSPGFPGPSQHYITYHRLKAGRLQNLQRDHAKRGERILLVSGVRSHESKRRMLSIGGYEHQGPHGRLGKCAWANPIVHWTSMDMNNYREAFRVPRSPVADLLHKSGECLCGAFAQKGELNEIAFWYPETAAYIRGLEVEAQVLGKRHSTWGYRNGQRPSKPPGPLCSDCQLRFEEAGYDVLSEMAGSGAEPSLAPVVPAPPQSWSAGHCP